MRVFMKHWSQYLSYNPHRSTLLHYDTLYQVRHTFLIYLMHPMPLPWIYASSQYITFSHYNILSLQHSLITTISTLPSPTVPYCIPSSRLLVQAHLLFNLSSPLGNVVDDYSATRLQSHMTTSSLSSPSSSSPGNNTSTITIDSMLIELTLLLLHRHRYLVTGNITSNYCYCCW